MAQSDTEFTGRMLDRLPAAEVPAALQARILADFDAVSAKRGAWAAWMRGLAALAWPNAPVWKPVTAFTLSLLFGLAAGVFIPSSNLTRDTSDPLQQQLAAASPALEMLGDL